ncbi:MAG: glycosyltransferase family 2 protein [Phocaeicola sp.]
MKHYPLVSIIMPVYQSEAFLSSSIDSVLNQTYSSIELILVNDGSTDDSASICERYSKKDHRVRVIHTQNSGPASARNRGLENATGYYVGFMDSDDKIDPRMYEVLVNNALNEKAAISGGSFMQQDENGVVSRDMHNESDYYVWRNNEAMRNFLERKQLDIYVWTKLYKRSMLEENLIRFEEGLKNDEDFLFNYKCFLHANCVVMQDIALYIYNHRVNSNCRSYPLNYLRNYLEGTIHRTTLIESAVKVDYPALLPLAKRQSILYAFIMISYSVKSPFIASKPYFKQIKDYLHANREQVIRERSYWSMSYVGVCLATYLPSKFYFYYRKWKDSLRK